MARIFSKTDIVYKLTHKNNMFFQFLPIFMASVTLCLLFIKRYMVGKDFFKNWYSIQINTQKLHALHLYAKLLFII